MSDTPKHPIQPLVDDDGITRFRANRIVRFLLDAGPFDMNDLAEKDFADDDRAQFAQLIGYSLSGFSELSYVDDDTYAAAAAMAEGDPEKDARIAALENTLAKVRAGLRVAAVAAFRIHEDDLEV